VAIPIMVGTSEMPSPERVYSPPSSLAGFAKAAPSTRNAERDASRSMEADLEGRLAELTEVAIISRSLARQYFRIARRFMAAARQASHTPHRPYYEAHLGEARKAHGQARKCLSFARLCHNRVQCLAAIGGYRSRSGPT
jgi:hypothetical protein